MNGLLELPGIGEKIATKLISHYGSEQSAIEVLRKHDVASLCEVPGISEKYAISLVHEIIAQEEGVSIGEFLQTQEASNVYDRIIGLIRSYSHTPYSRAKLSTYIPYPSKRADRITAIQKELKSYIELAGKLSKDKSGELDATLKKVRHLKDAAKASKSRDRAVMVDNKKDYDALIGRHVDQYLEVYQVDSMHELVDLAQGYSQALIVGNKFTGNDFPEKLNLEFVENPADIWWLVPEITIGFFAANKEPIEAAIGTIGIIRSKSDFPFCAYLEDARMLELSAEMSRITPEGDLVLGVDPEFDRLKNALKGYNEVLQTALKKANADLHERMEKNTVTFKGSDLLGMFGEKGDLGIKSLLEKEVAKAYAEVVSEAKECIKDKLSLKPFEMQHVDMMFNDEIVYPIEVNYRALDDFKNALNKQLVQRSLEMKRTSAKRLSKFEEICRDIVRDTLEFDTYFAIGLFAADYGLKMPKLSKSSGVNITGGNNIFLTGLCEEDRARELLCRPKK